MNTTPNSKLISPKKDQSSAMPTSLNVC